MVAWAAVGQRLGLWEAEVQHHQVDSRTTLHTSKPVCSGDSSFSKCVLGIGFMIHSFHMWHRLGILGVGGIWGLSSKK